MRYIKVLLLVLLFFLVMLFFVDNQEAFTVKYPLKLDLRFIPPFTTPTPVPCYFLLLGAFLVGALCTLLMLLWDRLSLSARASLLKRRANGFEKELNRLRKAREDDDAKTRETDKKIEAMTAEIAALKDSLKQAEARVAASDRMDAQKA